MFICVSPLGIPMNQARCRLRKMRMCSLWTPEPPNCPFLIFAVTPQGDPKRESYNSNVISTVFRQPPLIRRRRWETREFAKYCAVSCQRSIKHTLNQTHNVEINKTWKSNTQSFAISLVLCFVYSPSPHRGALKGGSYQSPVNHHFNGIPTTS